MRHLKFVDGDHVLIRISKRLAEKLWGKEDMSLCPVNLRPGLPFRPNIDVFAAEIDKRLISNWEHERKAANFHRVVNEFEWYNCLDSETGLYTAFYLIEPRQA